MNTPDQEVAGGKTQSTAQPALKDVFKGHFHIGATLSADQLSGREPDALAVVEKHFNSVTPENILKWEEVHPQPGRYNFELPDRYVAFGEKHQMHVIGHTLIWHNQTPAWVFQDDRGRPLDRETLLNRMRDHIHTVVGRYKGRIHGWDVVNEAILDDGSFRKSKWFDLIGEDYVAKAFEFARQADPSAELYYNEYDYEHRPKAEGVIRLIKHLQATGVRVDGVGIQGHWFLDFPRTDEIEAYVQALAGLKVKLMITELDVGVLPFCRLDMPRADLASFDAESQQKYNPYPNGLPDAVEEHFAQRYADLFSLFLRHRDLFKRVTFWGVHDGQSWRNYLPIAGRTDYPLLFDRRFQPKPAFHAVVQTAPRNS